MATTGIVATMLLTNTSFNIQAFLGIIVLVGIVVNNAIVLLDHVKFVYREKHLNLHQAILLASRRRLRPILMTTVTTVLGLTPMAMGFGEGGELQAPMARVVIGGLLSSTLVTLILIPVIYMTLEEWKHKTTG